MIEPTAYGNPLELHLSIRGRAQKHINHIQRGDPMGALSKPAPCMLTVMLAP